ncbi:MAG: methyltransferase [Bauldia sp.]
MSGHLPRHVDAFLGGRIEALQPEGHHHAGLEAMLLSAAVPSDFAGSVIDLGAGAGIAGMAVAARAPHAEVTLVERDATAIAAARESLARPGNAAFAARVTIVATDIAAPEAERIAAGLGRAFADIVVMNPPFRDPNAGTKSPHAERRAAHVLEEGALDAWVRTAASALKPGGHIVIIFRADGLGEILTALAGRFGAVAILPIHPRAALAAGRILVAAEKGSNAPSRILPGLTLHTDTGNTYLPEAERLLRHGASLSDVHPSWSL